MKVINSLAGQLGGTFVVERSPDNARSRFVVRFPYAKPA
jgi:hypothetical protein